MMPLAWLFLAVGLGALGAASHFLSLERRRRVIIRRLLDAR